VLRTKRKMILCLFVMFALPTMLLAGETDFVLQQEYRFEGGKIILSRNWKAQKRPKIGLVLSGGGARGIVHIGVLKALEKHHVPIDLIVGTSIGSVIGGLYATGYSPDEILSITQKIDWASIYRDKPQRTALFLGQKGEQDRYLLNLRFKNGNPYIPVAISPGQRIFTTLASLILRGRYHARNNFDNLRIPFRAVATDLVSGRVVVLKKGNLAEAINASIAIPLLFVPVDYDSMLLVDGGMRSNLPVHVAREEGCDIVIAVDVTSPLREKGEINAPWEIVDQATTIMGEFEREQERKEADVLIQPQIGPRRNDDYSNLQELVHIGSRATEKKIPEIKTLIREKSRHHQKMFPLAHVQFDRKKIPFSLYLSLQQLRHGGRVALGDVGQLVEKIGESGCFRKVVARVDTTRDSLHVLFRVKPFPTIHAIRILGVTRYDLGFLRQLMATRSGMPLNVRVLKKDLDVLTEQYRSDGYSLMQVDSLGWQAETHILTIRINEGRIGRLEVVGNHKVRRYVIAREFNRQVGRVFNWRQVQQALQNAYATQLFERVTLNIFPQGKKYVLQIRVKERSTVVMRLGGKYDTERKAQLYMEFGDECLLGLGVKSMLVGRFGMRDGKIGLKIRDDRIFTTYLTFDLQGYYTWQINPFTSSTGQHGSYKEIRRGARFQVGQQLRRLGQFIIELRHENVEDRRESGFFDFKHKIELRTFAIRAIADKRNRADFPTKGINNYWAWESGNRFVLGSKESYTKALVNLEGYYSYRQRATWHLRMFFGIGDKSMPFSENFRFGGLHSFYGLHQNEYFGRQVLIASAEYRYKLPFHPGVGQMMFKNFYLSLRYDFGGVWSNPNLVFSSKDFFSGIGGYFGIETPLGPFYLAWGHLTRGASVGYISFGFNY
jgi:NTE family protein